MGKAGGTQLRVSSDAGGQGCVRPVSTLCRIRLAGARFTACWLAACLLSTAALPAQSLRDPRFMSQAQPGFIDIYNLDYDHAEQVFLALKQQYPQHPAPPLYLGIISWLRELFRRQNLDLDLFLSPAFFTKATSDVMPAQQRKLFFDSMLECQAMSQRMLAQSPLNTDALYFLGSSYGILASFSITIDRSLRKAFSNGNTAYDYDSRVLRIDPKYYDAYMTVGMYEYIVGSIPWYLKWLAAIAGYHGTKEEGFKDVELAVTRGEYVKTDARILQMVLLMREERSADALRDAQELHRDFPRNYIFQINIAQILEKMGQTDQAASEYLDLVRQAEEKKPNYNLLPLATFRYAVGNKFFRMGRLPLAREQFQKSLGAPDTPERERALSQLRLGQILDLEGKRTEALEHYQGVLKLKDFEDSHDLARKYLRQAYRG